jgi:hypothetical protein
VKFRPSKCDECENVFDSLDTRSSPAKQEGEISYCPLCAYQRFHGSEAWAVWNGCQGVWCDYIGWQKDEITKILNEKFAGDDDAKVVPVRVYVETSDRVFFREWWESQAK